MEKELEDWYENYFEMFGTAGWKQLEKTFSELYEFKDSVPNLKDANDFHFVKGELSVLSILLNLETQYREIFAQLETEND